MVNCQFCLKFKSSLNVFVFVIVFILLVVFVIVSFFVQVMSPHHSDQMCESETGTRIEQSSVY